MDGKGVLMKVLDIMSENPRFCRPETDLAAAAMMMWDGDCGVLPVVDEKNKVRGVITDRDICIAVGSKHRRAEEIQVREVVNGTLFSCRPEDSVKKALKIMSDHQIRRIPVLGSGGDLKGVISINDMILALKNGKSDKELSAVDLLKAIQAICKHRRGGTLKKKNLRTAAA